MRLLSTFFPVYYLCLLVYNPTLFFANVMRDLSAGFSFLGPVSLFALNGFDKLGVVRGVMREFWDLCVSGQVYASFEGSYTFFEIREDL
jgi:hypothetical protein